MSKQDLTGRVALITGASGGIGRAIAVALACEGADVALTARRGGELAKLACEIRAAGRRSLALPADVTVQQQVEGAVAEVLCRWGQIDILVANAGQYIRVPVSEMQVADVELSMAVNFYGSLYPILAVLPHLLARRSGHLVVVTSMDGKKGVPPDGPYVAAKFALTGLAEVMRQELCERGVAVTTVLPGRVATPMIEGLEFPWISAPVAPEAVARAVIRAIHRRAAEVIVPPQARGLLYLNTFWPRLGDWIVRRWHLAGWSRPHAE